MHLHVVTTTQSKLENVLNDWLSDRDTTDYSVHHVGARDWVIVLRHSEHDVDDTTASTLVQVSDSEFVDSTDAMAWAEAFCRRFHGAPVSVSGGPEGLVDPGLMVGWFANAMAAAERAAAKTQRNVASPVRVGGTFVRCVQVEGRLP